MKKAVIATGGKQYIVSEGDTIEIELVGDAKSLSFVPLMVIDDKDVKVGTPEVSGAKVAAELVEESKLGEKVVSIRYKAKKRVRKVRGHRQRQAVVKIGKIS